ncbi:quinoprotein relay system zinc metallohydrolase 2 [Mesorhizobium sp. IMUNJ 23232]|uniref:quinoprotein relay system zinc metallohydrolase 2 n=1 Tax=Mesorhizobium sp. IMUNJ 23232 TaxID=3376064 RepID=UPI0037A39982
MHAAPIDPLRRRLVAGFACLGASAALLPCCPPRALAAENLDLMIKAVADGVFAFQGVNELLAPENRGTIANIGAVVGEEAVAVIDSGGSLVEGQAFLAAIKQITGKPVRYLINTHMHPDHIFGNAAFRPTGATIVGHRNLPAALEARAAFYLHSFREQLGEELMRGVEIIPPTLLVEDRLDLDLGGRSLELRAWKAAHTDNDLTVFDSKTKTLFTGDLVFLNHLPTLDGSLLGWMRQLNDLAAVDATVVVPGHGPVPSAWPQALDAERRYFEVLAGDLRKAIKDGVPLAKAVETAGLSERENWALFDDYNGRNATAAYAELEWE